MKRIILIAVSLVVMLGLPLLVWAHPGHGFTNGHTIWHYLFEPMHAFSVVLIAAVVLLYWVVKRKETTSKK